MKNIHIIPTDKPSRLWMTKLGNLSRCHDTNPIKKELGNNINIYITNSEEIKEGYWVYYLHNSGLHEPRIMEVIKPNYSDYKPYSIHFKSGFGVQEDCKKIILTTDPDLIAYGVQAIDDRFLEWFVKNPSCERVEVQESSYQKKLEKPIYKGLGVYRNDETIYFLKIIIPQEEPKQEDEIIDISDHDGIGNAVDNLNNEEPEKETIEEAAKKLYPITGEYFDKEFYMVKRLAFIEGAKYQSERMYTLEQISKDFIGEEGQSGYFDDWLDYRLDSKNKLSFREWFEQFKKK